MTDLTIRRARHGCRCGCAACAGDAVGQEIDLLARESLSAALMHAQQDGLEIEADATARRRGGAAGAPRSPRARPRSRAARTIGLPAIPPMRHGPMRLTKAVRLAEVIAGRHPAYDRPVTGTGRIYVLSVPGIDRPLYVGEVRPDSRTQTLADRMRQHARKTGPQDCISPRNVRESCVLREALLGRFEPLRTVLARAGLGPDRRRHVEQQIKAGNVYVQYAEFRLPRGIDRRDLNARTQLQHSAELFAKNQLRALIRSNSLTFEEEEEREQPRRARAEYRVV
ncbi:hypothetical protein [Methylobacterium nonmethylotrophicum]|uniref:Uncharacterized protein n=1 Tax=Methylobacterium nonmethylotrophicum TaxID=1141884 RepID=A0A4Z0NS05_9HYPH|nr:hypothetical protein [Methylobacterium nonmethylotrophicum]TGD98724.1 hypothetical protein EU555_15440 [Methylobacterium nonmethylotrophicum]